MKRTRDRLQSRAVLRLVAPQMIQLIWIKELSPLRHAVSRGVLYTLSAFAMWLVYYG
jgi:hypothetical protein